MPAVAATRPNAPHALPLRRQIGRLADREADTMRRLSTGRRVTRGRDDPAALISGETLRSEGRKLDESVKNADRARNLADVIDGALGQISESLRQVGRLVSANASLVGREERAANQLEIDELLEDVDKLIDNTTHNGRPVLRTLPGPTAYDLAPFIDFNAATTGVQSASQDDNPPFGASVTPVNGGRGVTATGNAWRYVQFPDT